MPMNFANGKIYAIRSHQTEQIYVGSTCQPLYKRFHQHKKSNCSSREIMKYPDVFIELLENYACADKNELNRREGELIRLHNSINKRIAGRTQSEYREEHKDELKQYREEHKDEKKQYNKQYNKQYRTDNKQEITEKKKQKYNCFCGGRYTNNDKSKHSKSKKHIEFMRTLETTSA
jgi:hypothetical protein